jgi:hypothetical protein
MIKNNTTCKYSVIISILFIAILFTNIFADSPCGTFEIKITYYSNSDKQSSGYIHFDNFKDGKMVFNAISENFTINKRIRSNQINYNKIRGTDSTFYDKILAVNKKFMSDTNITIESNGYNVRDTIKIADSIYKLTWRDTSMYTYYTIRNSLPDFKLDSMKNSSTHTVYYANTKYLNLDTIKLILLDTIILCGDFDQIQWLKNNQVLKISSDKFATHFQIVNSETQQSWIDFLCYDPNWSKSRVISLLNLNKIDIELQEYNNGNVFKTFSPAIQNAIQSGKVLYFFRWCP